MRALHEVHHRVPQCLLRLHDRAHAPGDLDAEALAAWFEWELEAMLYGVDPNVTREDLENMISTSTVEISRAEHRRGHDEAGDFARWGRRGGLRTLRRYGRTWFSLISRRRWGRIDGDDLAVLWASRHPLAGRR